MHWCSLGLLPALTFFAPMKCVWTSQQQLSRGGGAPKVQITGHAGGLPRRTEAASWLSHGALWLQAETGVGTFTLLDHISFESIHYSLHFATIIIITNVQHPSLSKAIWQVKHMVCWQWADPKERDHDDWPQTPQLTENWVWVPCLVLNGNRKPSTVDSSVAFFLHFLLPKKGA